MTIAEEFATRNFSEHTSGIRASNGDWANHVLQAFTGNGKQALDGTFCKVSRIVEHQSQHLPTKNYLDPPENELSWVGGYGVALI
jgi:hypothetical protein